MDKKMEEEILNEIRKVQFGEIRIILNKTAGHVDIITENRRRIYKKNIYHEG